MMGIDVPETPVAETETDRSAALRALRNLEATEARLERNAKREAEETRGKLIAELLPVLDNLDRVLAHRGDPATVQGVRMVKAQLEGVLRNYGVEKIDASDRPFDPSLHEAISVAPVGDPRQNGHVLAQVEPGYAYAGKLLRPAKVTVGKYVAPAPRPAAFDWR